MAPLTPDEALAADMAVLDALGSSFFTLSSLSASGDTRDALSDASAPISFGPGSSCEQMQPRSTGPLTDPSANLRSLYSNRNDLQVFSTSSIQLTSLSDNMPCRVSSLSISKVALPMFVPASPGADYDALFASSNSLPSLGLRLGHSSLLSVYVPETPLQDNVSETRSVHNSDGALAKPLLSEDGCSESHQSTPICSTGPEANFSQTQLVSGMLVWAPWRGNLWAPALLAERTSRTRDLWRVRFAHWRDERLSPAIAAEELLPCSASSLVQGDRVCVVQNRRLMDTVAATFGRWAPDGRLLVLPDDADVLDFDTDTALSSDDLLPVSLSHVMLERSVMRHKLRGAPPRVSGPQAPASLALRRMFAGSVFVLSLGERSSLSRESSTARRILAGQVATRIARMGGCLLSRETTADEVLDICMRIKQRSCDLDDGERRVSMQLTRLSLDCVVPAPDPEALYVITDGVVCRTAKAFVAARLGAPVVHIDWLSLCERAQSILPWHAHAVPLVDKSAFANAESAPLRASKAPGTLVHLDGQCVALDCAPRAVADWACVLRACGASNVLLSRADISRADLVIAESVSRVESLLRADGQSIPIVTLAHFLDAVASRVDFL